MLETLQTLDTIRLNYSIDAQFIINISLAVIMFGVALGINPAQFAQLFHNPKPVLLGVFSQFVVLPAVSFLLVYILRHHLSVNVAVGMILVACCPGGNISNFISSISKANTELSICMTALATVLAIFITPVNFAFWGGMYTQTSDVLQPLVIPYWEVLRTVLLLLGAPLILGILCKYNFPRITKCISKFIRTGSIVFFTCLVLAAFVANLNSFLLCIKYIFFIVLLHNGLALVSGYAVGLLGRLGRPERRTLSIETGIQNSGLGLALIFNPDIFPSEINIGGMAIVTAWWGIWHIIAGLGIAFVWSKR